MTPPFRKGTTVRAPDMPALAQASRGFLHYESVFVLRMPDHILHVINRQVRNTLVTATGQEINIPRLAGGYTRGNPIKVGWISRQHLAEYQKEFVLAAAHRSPFATDMGGPVLLLQRAHLLTYEESCSILAMPARPVNDRILPIWAKLAEMGFDEASICLAGYPPQARVAAGESPARPLAKNPVISRNKPRRYIDLKI